jgi:ferrous iron transport protein B
MAIVMIGNPNVGKSMVLNRITGSNFIVYNYAGTSLEISKAEISLPGTKKTIIDTPGIYSIYSSGPEQIAIKELLEREEPELIFNVVDANNLERNLILTYELKELKIPVIILVNQIDRARKNGLQINKERMEQIIGAPVVFFSALTGEGLMEVFDLLGKDSKALNWPSKVQVDSLNDCFKGCSFNCANCALATENCLHEDDFRRAEMARYTAQLVVQKQSIVSRYWLDKIEALLDRPYLGTFLLLMLVYLAFLALLEFIKLSEGPLAMVLSPISNGLEKLLIDLLPAGTWSTVISKAVPEGLIIPFTIIMPAMLIVVLHYVLPISRLFYTILSDYLPDLNYFILYSL